MNEATKTRNNTRTDKILGLVAWEKETKADTKGQKPNPKP